MTVLDCSTTTLPAEYLANGFLTGILQYMESGGELLLLGTSAEILDEAGYARLGHLDGDMSGWREAGLPVEQ